MDNKKMDHHRLTKTPKKNIEKMELFDFNDLKYNKIRLIKTTITLTFWLI